MFPRLFKLPKSKSFFLFGPRGTGKTSWLKTNLGEARWFDLLDHALYQRLLSDPSRIERDLENHRSEHWIVIDEIQRVPELLPQVQRLIENKRFMFALTGSSARKLKAKGVNLLGGRALYCSFFPLTVQELGAAFDILKSLKNGHLPAVFSEDDPVAFLKSYVVAYMREEVQQEGIVRNLAAFSRFLEAASFSQAQVLNISAVSRDCDVERKVVEHYFEILEDLLIAFRLPVFSKKAKRKLLKHSKFFFFDCGIYRAIRPHGPLDSDADLDGPTLETLFVQEILALNSYFKLGYELYYWRTADQRFEVDVVCYGPKHLKAFEIKRSSRVREEDVEGLLEFKKDYPMAELYLLCAVKEKTMYRGVSVLPVSTAFSDLDKIL